MMFRNLTRQYRRLRQRLQGERRSGRSKQRPLIKPPHPQVGRNPAWQNLSARSMTPGLWQLRRTLDGTMARMDGRGYRQSQTLPHWLGQPAAPPSPQRRRLAWRGQLAQKRGHLLPALLRNPLPQPPHTKFAQGISHRYLVHRRPDEGELDFYRQQPEQVSSTMTNLESTIDAGHQALAGKDEQPPVLLQRREPMRHIESTIPAKNTPPPIIRPETGRQVSRSSALTLPTAVRRLFSFRRKAPARTSARQRKAEENQPLTRELLNLEPREPFAAVQKHPSLTIEPTKREARRTLIPWRRKDRRKSPEYPAKVMRAHEARDLPYSPDQETVGISQDPVQRQIEESGSEQMTVPDRPVQSKVVDVSLNRPEQELGQAPLPLPLGKLRDPQESIPPHLPVQQTDTDLYEPANALPNSPLQTRSLWERLPLLSLFRKTSNRPKALPPRASNQQPETTMHHQPAQLQRMAGPSRGQPLPLTVRTRLGRMLGMTVPDATVHTGSQAAAVTERLGADAATVGQHIFVKPEQAHFDTPRGLALLGHELVHVAQGAWRGSPSALQLQADENQALAAESLILKRAAAEIDQAIPQFAQNRMPLGSKRAWAGENKINGRNAAVTYLAKHDLPLSSQAAPLRLAQSQEIPAATPGGTAGTIMDERSVNVETPQDDPAPDIEELAEEVLRRLRYRLSLERELRGI